MRSLFFRLRMYATLNMNLEREEVRVASSENVSDGGQTSRGVLRLRIQGSFAAGGQVDSV